MITRVSRGTTKAPGLQVGQSPKRCARASFRPIRRAAPEPGFCARLISSLNLRAAVYDVVGGGISSCRLGLPGAPARPPRRFPGFGPAAFHAEVTQMPQTGGPGLRTLHTMLLSMAIESVVHREQVLVGDACQPVEPAADPAGQDHAFTFSSSTLTAVWRAALRSGGRRARKRYPIPPDLTGPVTPSRHMALARALVRVAGERPSRGAPRRGRRCTPTTRNR